jgi:hypothetical protein
MKGGSLQSSTPPAQSPHEPRLPGGPQQRTAQEDTPPFPRGRTVFTCLTCSAQTRSPLFLWSYPVCRECAARIRAQTPQDSQEHPVHGQGSAHGLERVPPLIDHLDVQLALWIMESMLDSLKSTGESRS